MPAGGVAGKIQRGETIMRKHEFITDFLNKYTIRQFFVEELAAESGEPVSRRPRRSRKKQFRRGKKPALS